MAGATQTIGSVFDFVAKTANTGSNVLNIVDNAVSGANTAVQSWSQDLATKEKWHRKGYDETAKNLEIEKLVQSYLKMDQLIGTPDSPTRRAELVERAIKVMEAE